MSFLGSDVSDLPQRFPAGVWLPIDAPVMSMENVVVVTVDGERTVATVDTGAMVTSLSRMRAEALGIASAARGGAAREASVIDAHGNTVRGIKARIGELEIGGRMFREIDANVIDTDADFFLIGADVLAELDLYLAADEALIGFFPAGMGPRDTADRVASGTGGLAQLLVRGEARGVPGNPVSFTLVVDTGAWNTSVPLLTGLNGKLPTDVAYASTTVSVGGEQENRGRFVLAPLLLGRERADVGRVLALGSTLGANFVSRTRLNAPQAIDAGGAGLLGNDVLQRRQVVLSLARQELRFQERALPPPQRRLGPGGVRCGSVGADTPCVTVALRGALASEVFDESELPGVCLAVDVDGAFAGRTLELAITGADADLLQGGVLRAFVTANSAGAHHCFHLWRQLGSLVKEGTPLSLRWMRTEDVHWTCDPMKTRCLIFTGPLAPLARVSAAPRATR